MSRAFIASGSTLASGRFAMIDNGLGFQLVPWIPSLETRTRQAGERRCRSWRDVEWSFGRKRGLVASDPSDLYAMVRLITTASGSR